MKASPTFLFTFCLSVFLTLQTDAVFAQGKLLKTQITTTDGRANPGFLVSADADGVTLAASPDGSSASKLAYSKIRTIKVDPPDEWQQATMLLARGEDAEAEKAFAKIAEDYNAIIPLKDSWGSLARLNQFKAIRNQGKYAELGEAMDRQLARPLQLGDYHKPEMDNLRAWALLGKGDISQLQAYVSQFEEDSIPKLAVSKPFRSNPSDRIIATVAFMRGFIHEKQGDLEAAILDYHTSMTYNQGSEQSLYGLANLASLRIIAGKLKENPNDKALQRFATALATTYRDLGSKGNFPEEFKPFIEQKSSTETAAP